MTVHFLTKKVKKKLQRERERRRQLERDEKLDIGIIESCEMV